MLDAGPGPCRRLLKQQKSVARDGVPALHGSARAARGGRAPATAVGQPRRRSRNSRSCARGCITRRHEQGYPRARQRVVPLPVLTPGRRPRHQDRAALWGDATLGHREDRGELAFEALHPGEALDIEESSPDGARSGDGSDSVRAAGRPASAATRSRPRRMSAGRRSARFEESDRSFGQEWLNLDPNVPRELLEPRGRHGAPRWVDREFGTDHPREPHDAVSAPGMPELAARPVRIRPDHCVSETSQSPMGSGCCAASPTRRAA